MSDPIPKGWIRAHLGDLFTERKECGIEGLPTMSVTMHDGLVMRNGLDRRTETTLDASAHLLVKQGDIAYNMMRMWQGACGIAAQNCIVSPAYVVLTPKPSVDPRYFVAWVKSARGLHLLWAYSHGLTDDRRRLYFDDFCQIPIDLPPLDEQRRIADALATCDRAIEAAETLVATKRQELTLTISRVSADWDMLPLDDFGKWTGGGTPSKAREEFWSNGTMPWVSPKDMNGWRIYDAQDHITEKAVAASATNLVPRGAILIVTRSGILRTRVPVAVVMRDVTINQDLKALVPDDPSRGELLCLLLQHANERLRQAAMKTGTTVESLDTDAVKAFEVAFPSDAQEAAARSLFVAMADAAESISKLADFLRVQKRGLMQKLMMGEWRLSTDASEEAA